ncbi:hypothetical protein [Pseudoprevotella muciniphila]|uniref:hypothetical protein n=1 Tax=Pseudoprevotella muciniphila TaxID=2133944 RepID=UPI0018667DE0|nr:hypothetical protein [Pseudoprevotella muciniphila]
MIKSKHFIRHISYNPSMPLEDIEKCEKELTKKYEELDKIIDSLISNDQLPT